MKMIMSAFRLACLFTLFLPYVARAQSPVDIAQAAGVIINTIDDVKKAVESFGGWIAEGTHGVTSLKVIDNYTDQTVELWKVDGSKGKESMSASANEKNKEAGMWIPWADDADTWKEHHALIKVGGQVIACIWQQNGIVRMNNVEAFNPNAPVVPGISVGGGDRTIFVSPANFNEKKIYTFVIGGVRKH